MSLSVWTQLSGYNLGTFPEAISLTQQLPVNSTPDVTYEIISGSLPNGLRISGSTITGAPNIIPNDTISTFCIRARKGINISDRTFTIKIIANNLPTFISPPGEIAFGTQLYALDQTYVEYQIEAFDLGTAAGQKLTYFISSTDGELPPGLTLSPSGLISGFIKPVLRITVADGSGTYDETYFDAVAYDFATLPTNGYDSYIYDNVFYDYNLGQTRPASLSRNFQFTVTLSDGQLYTKRTFRIFVIGDDTFRADSTVLDSVAGMFTADATYLRQPAFKTANNLGTYRANNYITLPIELYDRKDVLLRLETTNEEIFANTYQVTNTDNVIGSNTLTISKPSGTPQFGQFLTFTNYYQDPGAGTLYQIQYVTNLGNGIYRLLLTDNLTVTLPDNIGFYIGSLSTLPSGLSFNINTGELYGETPYQPAITKSFKFTITAIRSTGEGDNVNSSRTFTMSLIGEIDSVITWNTNSNLGNLAADYNSTLRVSASTTVPNAEVIYTLIGGHLPPGLTLNIDGEIIGKVHQYQGNNNLGLIRFDNGNLTFDGGTTGFDRGYTFTIQAQDQYNYSAVTKTFTVHITTPNTYSYSNIKVQPYLKSDQRTLWQEFINNNSIFPPNSIYRTNDVNFGIQNNISMVVYAGIQTKVAAAYVGAIGLNHKKKRFIWGDVKTAVAVDPITKESVYEVVYVEMLDPQESNGKHLPTQLYLSNQAPNSNQISVDSSTNFWSVKLEDLVTPAPYNDRPEPIITVDSAGYRASNAKPGNYFPNTINNWRKRIRSVGANERNYLPLWMRSIQPGTKQEVGYKLAVPLCYCLVGEASTIALNIKYSGFDFKMLDFTIDRYIIDSVTGDTSDKYLVFRNDRITV
jgi:hypothetical protein